MDSAAPYKVLHIIKSLGRGGAEMLLPETLRLHDKNKFEFHYVYFLPWKNQMVDSLIAQGGRVTCIAANNNISLILKVRKVLKYVREHKIQIIHAHLPWAGIVSRLVARYTDVPVIYTEHNKQERYHILTRITNLATLNWLSRIIAVSADVAESIVRHKRNLTSPIQVIVNGVNTRRFTPQTGDRNEIRNVLQIPVDAPVIGTIAVFRFQKRLDVWLDIASTILASIPEAHFIIVGDGPLKPILMEKRQQLGIEKKVHFVGLQTEVRPFLATFDLYMMSSIFEGLPVALLEAMASGCPVISTDAGGVKEVIRHEIDGLLCSTDEPQKLSQMAISLLRSADRKAYFASQSRKRVVEFFSMEKMVNELENLYTKTLSEPSKKISK
ncbi:glycosyltransferase [Chryseolinea sp. H1M3-3]|uniref:glycosyltransferase n=1 Tax=Chryseolinea sp. H1M3-3 TaxID=3034144 RepID=UPI0023EAFF4B|nr:glycosyltransferase [Chryseolinea sp. H1M3-3]